LAVTSPHRAEYHVRGKAHAREGDDIRVVVTLRQAASDRLLWADGWTGPREGTGGFEERVADRVASKLLATIFHVVMDRAWRKEVPDLTVRDLIKRAQFLATIGDPASQYQGLEFASKAAERAPDDPLPAALAAKCHVEWCGHTLSAGHAREFEAGRTRLLRA